MKLLHRGDATPERGGRSITRFVKAVGRFVDLAHDQGTRLVDVFERYVEVMERQAEAMERMADRLQGPAKEAPWSPTSSDEPGPPF